VPKVLFLDNCETVGCHQHADCSWMDDGPVCQCKDGYHGDGKTCTKGLKYSYVIIVNKI